MHPRFRANARYVRRFHIEACAAASLHHTNIVSVFDYGETDGVVYYAMPFIDGQSLEKVLRDVQRIRGLVRGSPFPVLRLGDRSEACRTQLRGGAVAGREPLDVREEPTRLIVQGLIDREFRATARAARPGRAWLGLRTRIRHLPPPLRADRACRNPRRAPRQLVVKPVGEDRRPLLS